MPAKTRILGPTTFNDFASLYRYLRSEPMRALLSSSQAETLADVIDASLPEDVMLEQRSPKGTTYIYLDGEPFGRVNAAARYIRPR